MTGMMVKNGMFFVFALPHVPGGDLQRWLYNSLLIVSKTHRMLPRRRAVSSCIKIALQR